MTTLPEPDFIMRDAAQVLREVFEAFEAESGRALDPASPEAQLLRTWTYREAVLRMAIQDAAKLNLLRYTRFPIVDHLGELVQLPRLAAQPSKTTLRYSLEEVHAEPVPVPKESRVESKDGRARWQTDEDAVIAAGDLFVDVPATALEPGPQTNGYIPGQIAAMVDLVPQVATVENTTASSGGTPAESDARYIERMLLAPDTDAAGSEQAYRLGALSASSSVADAKVLSPTPGTVRVVVLATDGLPSVELLDLVEAKLSAETDRPMNDTVLVEAPTEVAWTLSVRVKLYRSADLDSTMEAAEAGALAYRDSRQTKLGRDLVPSQIQRAVGVTGVYSVTVDLPAHTDVDSDEWANCEEVLVEFDGWVDEDFDEEELGDA